MEIQSKRLDLEWSLVAKRERNRFNNDDSLSCSSQEARLRTLSSSRERNFSLRERRRDLESLDQERRGNTIYIKIFPRGLLKGELWTWDFSKPARPNQSLYWKGDWALQYILEGGDGWGLGNFQQPPPYRKGEWGYLRGRVRVLDL